MDDLRYYLVLSWSLDFFFSVKPLEMRIKSVFYKSWSTLNRNEKTKSLHLQVEMTLRNR